MQNSDAYGPAIAELLGPRTMPLDAGEPNTSVRPQLEQPTAALFTDGTVDDADMAACCHSALWLRHNFLDQSHRLSQQIGTTEGSYWHGLMHRREGDFGNSKYWFRRVGDHPVFAQVAAELPSLVTDDSPPRARTLANAPWDPATFIDLCGAAVAGDAGLQAFCETVQAREWELLFEFCFGGATR